MKKHILKHTITLWHRMTFDNDKYSKKIFELIEGFYELTDNHLVFILTKSSF